MTAATNNVKHLSTHEAARSFGVKPETLHHAMWSKGHYYGITPIKMPNRRLLWPASDVQDLINAHS